MAVDLEEDFSGEGFDAAEGARHCRETDAGLSGRLLVCEEREARPDKRSRIVIHVREQAVVESSVRRVVVCLDVTPVLFLDLDKLSSR